MMGVTGFVIAILGCADGATACRPVQQLPTVYESRTQCLAATSGALEAATALDFPTITAECRAERPAAAERRAAGKIRRG